MGGHPAHSLPSLGISNSTGLNVGTGGLLPNLMGSEVGKWMLESNLMEYYSEPMNKDLRQALEDIEKPAVSAR